jgi:hypothetical protein
MFVILHFRNLPTKIVWGKETTWIYRKMKKAIAGYRGAKRYTTSSNCVSFRRGGHLDLKWRRSCFLYLTWLSSYRCMLFLLSCSRERESDQVIHEPCSMFFLFSYIKELSALLVPQVFSKSKFGLSTFFSLKLPLKHLIRSTYHPWQQFWPVFFTFLCHAGKCLAIFYRGRVI